MSIGALKFLMTCTLHISPSSSSTKLFKCIYRRVAVQPQAKERHHVTPKRVRSKNFGFEFILVETQLFNSRIRYRLSWRSRAA